MGLSTQYDPVAVEVALYQRWQDAGYFRADEQQVLSGAKRPFSIVLPPPNVTGNLHVGHALDHTLMDILARWHRMSGDEVLWLPGRDHAGIATQTLVERRLAIDGLTYRAERIINWCPGCRTALSDIEVDHSEDSGELVSIRYGGVDGDPANSIVVAT